MNRPLAHRFAMAAAFATLVGIVVSGPLALLLVNATHPQPPWQDAALFARSYLSVRADSARRPTGPAEIAPARR